jgi:NAD(P)-dependent dehydrogenase (short-subunit alcohol dehydrogenase family)
MGSSSRVDKTLGGRTVAATLTDFCVPPRTPPVLSNDWTAAEMGDLSDKTAVVTGANSGLGYEAAKAFATHGANVVLACRNVERGVAAGEEIREAAPETRLTVIELDLADLASVQAFAANFTDTHDDLHILCNNAGVMAIPRSETEQGFETQFGVNHLGHFALTSLLLDELRETDGETRVVTQSSGLHENGRIDFDDLQHEDSYDKWDAYGQSKLANVLFAYALQRRLRAAGVEDVASVACHPGYAATNLQQRGPEQEGSTLGLWGMQAANAVLAQDAATGALPLLYAATAPDTDGGEYVGPGGFQNMRGHPETQRSSDRSYDETTAKRLWEVTEELTGARYDLPAPN